MKVRRWYVDIIVVTAIKQSVVNQIGVHQYKGIFRRIDILRLICENFKPLCV